MPLASDTGFRPDVHGFGFPNLYRDTVIRVPRLGRVILPKGMRHAVRGGRVVADGRCGGMSFAALDYFFAGQPVPRFANEQMPPPDGHPLSVFIGVRQRDSLLSRGAVRFLTWTARQGEGGSSSAAGALTGDELGPTLDHIRASFARGRPVVLGLVRTRRLARVFENHQVVGFALEAGERAPAILIYDSRFPLRAHRLVLESGSPIRQLDEGGVAVDEWRGVFPLRYTRSEPPVWDGGAHLELPPQPLALTATPEGDSILLSWVADAMSTSGCEVQRLAGDGTWKRLALLREPAPALYQHVVTRPLGPDAAFRVRALNHNGFSRPTPEVRSSDVPTGPGST